MLLCFQTVGILFKIIDLLKRDRNTLERAGRQSFRTFREIPSGPTDFVVNCLKAHSRSLMVIFLNLKLGLGEVPWGE